MFLSKCCFLISKGCCSWSNVSRFTYLNILMHLKQFCLELSIINTHYTSRELVRSSSPQGEQQFFKVKSLLYWCTNCYFFLTSWWKIIKNMNRKTARRSNIGFNLALILKNEDEFLDLKSDNNLRKR